MKFSESWLREWVNPNLSREALCHMLTMAGLEVEEASPVSESFSGVLIGQILKIKKHPQADRLQVCEVTVGTNPHLNIVCGATNIKEGMKVPVAMLNAVLPNNLVIKATTIRGEPSQGMLCSAAELAFTEQSEGIFVLPQDAPLGEDLRQYLKLNDFTIDVSITPNRGDCLSIRGLAREVSALSKVPLKSIPLHPVLPATHDTLPISVTAKAGCPHYVGRVIRGVKADTTTPIWLKEKLSRSGIRSISPIVDVTNYVMLELGQPMHAFDLNTIEKKIVVRSSKSGEKIILLDGSEKELDENSLVIADDHKPLAIAGVMGGLDSSVTLLTTDIFLESAYFSSDVVARQRQYYGLNSDSAYRFERGVDASIQREAIERATQLILEIAGGEAGPVTEQISEVDLPKQLNITVTSQKIRQVLGMEIPPKYIDDIFARLHFQQKKSLFSLSKKDHWEVSVPPYRFDLNLAEDLIEEVARLHGYDNIPTHQLTAKLSVPHVKETTPHLMRLRLSFSQQGFHEIISYSFVDKKLQSLLNPIASAEELMNPITSDMTVMRTNLWPGLVNVLLYNKSRQQQRVRLFEIGTCFTREGNTLLQQPKLAGLIAGLAEPEQWGETAREADFFDLKGQVVNTLKQAFPAEEWIFSPSEHPVLHPGQSAEIYHHDKRIGVLGALHPVVIQAIDLPQQTKVYVFELDLNALPKEGGARSKEISKFPEIRRDIAILVNQAVPAKAIQDTIRFVAGDWLKDVFIFDVYQGKGISSGLKSIALGLVLQHSSRTLVDDEMAALMEQIINTLKGQLGAELRS